MTNPRNVLNKIKWSKDYDFSKIEIWYIHRGAPNDTKIIKGEDILKIDKTFIKTKFVMIPLHRIFKIKYMDKTIFDR